MISLSRIAFEIVPCERLSDAERAMLSRIGHGTPEGTSADFVLQVADEPPFVPSSPLPAGQPARIQGAGSRVQVDHSTFVAEIDPITKTGRLYRNGLEAFPLQATLRTALVSLLPGFGGVPLHAAGIVIDGRAHIFYGVSGAGKSTLAERSPYPVLSDEMVAICRDGDRFYASATGFWGSLDRDEAPHGYFPLAGIYSIRKGSPLAITTLEESSLRRLLEVLLVPALPSLWTLALEVVQHLSRDIPQLELTWHSGDDPWPLIEGRRGSTP